MYRSVIGGVIISTRLMFSIIKFMAMNIIMMATIKISTSISSISDVEQQEQVYSFPISVFQILFSFSLVFLESENVVYEIYT